MLQVSTQLSQRERARRSGGVCDGSLRSATHALTPLPCSRRPHTHLFVKVSIETLSQMKQNRFDATEVKLAWLAG